LSSGDIDGRDVGLVEGHIAKYGAGGYEATVWLGRAASSSAPHLGRTAAPAASAVAGPGEVL